MALLVSSTPTPPTQTDEQRAVALLASEAGTPAARGNALVKALKAAFAAEALGIMLGMQAAGGTAVDQRVARLDAIVGALAPTEYVPSAYELGAMLAITPGQARTVLNTYRARFPDKLRDRMKDRIAKVTPSASGSQWVFQFDDVPTLDYAADDFDAEDWSSSWRTRHS